MADEEPQDPCPRCGVFIIRARMPYHKTRCKKNYPDAKFKTCPYDSRHDVNPKEYESHLKSCTARAGFHQTTGTENNFDDVSGILPIQAFIPSLDHSVETARDEDNSISPLKIVQETNSQNVEFGAPYIGGSRNQRRNHRFESRRLVQERENAVASNYKEIKKQENKKSVQKNKDSPKAVLQTRSNENSSSDDLAKESVAVESEPSNPVIKSEVEALKITEMTISSEKDMAEFKHVEPKVCAFSYAAALSGKNKKNTNETNTSNATNLNSFLKNKINDSRK